jgi:Protein of unknown function (DUF2637)
MTVQSARTDDLAPIAGQGGPAELDSAPRALRVLGLVAAFLGVAALAAATFVLSYSAIRAVALQAGITPRLARGYPLLLDAMLVIVLAAVLALRGAGLPSRVLAWLTLLLVAAAAAGADALHAAGHRLPRQAAAITAAVLPWVLVLLAFVLLLAMLRHARLRRTPSAAELVIGEAAAEEYLSGDEADSAGADDAVPDPADSAAEPDDDAAAETERAGADDTPQAASDEVSAADEAADPDMPIFHRMWSSPTPPAGTSPG